MDTDQISTTNLTLIACDVSAALVERISGNARLSAAYAAEAVHLNVIAETMAAFALVELLELLEL